jgi:hypothetical protein
MGFHEAIVSDRDEDLAGFLATVPANYRHYAYEGAGIGLALLDQLDGGSISRLQRFAEGIATQYGFMLQLGGGWSIPFDRALRRYPEAFLSPFDTVLRWIPLVGLGTRQAYFHWPRYVDYQNSLNLSAFGRQVFDQGIGRALWLGEGGFPDLVAARVGQFPPSRQRDLWSGVGFGCSNYGVAFISGLEYLHAASGPWSDYLAEGAALGATARWAPSSPDRGLDLVCRTLCGIGAEDVIRLTNRAAKLTEGIRPKYELWRHAIRTSL